MAFFAAVRFLTILPLGRKILSPEELSTAQSFFPLVGLFLGLALAGLEALCSRIWPPALVSALLVTFLVIATSALHLEGFLDTCDGLFGGATKEHRLAIMRDKHVGAFAVAGGTSLILLKWAALFSLPQHGGFATLVLFPTLSRWAMVLAMYTFPYARAEGLGVAFQSGTVWPRVLGAAVITLVSASVFSGMGGLVLFLFVSFLAWCIGWMMSTRLGGLTGDTYGAINELSEVIVLLVATAIASPEHLRPLPQWWEG